MKPTKNKFFCKDSARIKMLFETEKKATNFIKFNSEEIEAENGYGPVRAYYCMFCDGWHVTSKKDALNIKTKGELVLDEYKKHKAAKKQEQEKIQEAAAIRIQELTIILDGIENNLDVATTLLDFKNRAEFFKIMNAIKPSFEKALSIKGLEKRKKSIELKIKSLNFLVHK